MATFTYSTAGLYTVGVVGRATRRRLPAAGGHRRAAAALRQPADAGVLRPPPRALDPDRRGHAARSSSSTLQVIEHDLPTEGVTTAGPGATRVGGRVPAYRSGYVQTCTPRPCWRPRRHRDVVVLDHPDGRGARDQAGRPAVGLAAVAGAAAAGPRPVREPPPATRSGSASSAPPSRTSRSVSASSPTSRSRRCRRRSTTPTPRSRRSSTCRSSSRRWPARAGQPVPARPRRRAAGRRTRPGPGLLPRSGTGQIRRYGRPNRGRPRTAILHSTGQFCRDDNAPASRHSTS